VDIAWLLIAGHSMVALAQQREAYTGLLVPLLSQGLDGSTMKGFRAMHEALKERTQAENRP
jgi:hypothetical protein